MKQVPGILEDGENGLPGTMRNLMIHGARSVMRVAEKKAEPGKLDEKVDGSAVSTPPSRRLDEDCLPLVQQERGGGRAGEQECPDRVGTAGP